MDTNSEEIYISKFPVFAIGKVGDKDISIISINNRYLTFQCCCNVKSDYEIELAILNFEFCKYEHYCFKVLNILKEIKNQKYTEYKIEFGELVNGNINNFQKNIEQIYLISNKDFLFLNGKFNFYPLQLDNNIAETKNEYEKNFYMNKLSNDSLNGFKDILDKVEVCYAVVRNYKNLCNLGIKSFIHQQLKRYHLIDHPIFSGNFKRLYIGNEFCPNLFPNYTVIKKIIEHAENENISLTISFPFLKEHYINSYIDCLSEIDSYIQKRGINVELVLNDFGLIDYVNSNFTHFDILLGRLLNKYKKDPRSNWKMGHEQYTNNVVKNSLTCDHYLSFLQHQNITRIEFESSSQYIEIPPKSSSLHFPFYQILTSESCILHSIIKNGSPHIQNIVKSCSKYCEKNWRLFPKHLNIIGAGNSIFGYNDKVMVDPEQFKWYVNQGIDRMVYEDVLN